MSVSRSGRFRIVASLVIGGALVACALDPLNPQPLPPSPQANFGEDGGFYSPARDAGTRTEDSLSSDAGTTKGPDGASPLTPNANDAGDGGDAGDAGPDADAATTP